MHASSVVGEILNGAQQCMHENHVGPTVIILIDPFLASRGIDDNKSGLQDYNNLMAWSGPCAGIYNSATPLYIALTTSGG